MQEIETAPDFGAIQAQMIASEEPMDVAEFFREFSVAGSVASARAYVTALGVCELRVDGCKVGEE